MITEQDEKDMPGFSQIISMDFVRLIYDQSETSDWSIQFSVRDQYTFNFRF